MKRRYTRQIRQERVSRKQIEERFAEAGWVATPPEVDLGEDFIVHVYIAQRATGVLFNLQAKSTEDIEKFRVGNDIAYPIFVKDLTHWEEFSTPVILVVWDVNRRDGKWAPVSDLLQHLNKANPNWRNKKKVNVRLPYASTLNDDGIVVLQRVVGQHYYALISKGRDLDLKLSLDFSEGPDGDAQRKAFDLHIREGEPVTLRGRVIKDLRLPDWWQGWLGGFDPDEIMVQIGPIVPREAVSISIDALGGGFSAHLPYRQFQIVNAGSERVRLESADPHEHISFEVEIRKNAEVLSGGISVRAKGIGGQVADVAETLQFLRVMGAGGTISLTLHYGTQSQVLNLGVSPHPEMSPDLRLVDLVSKLNLLQIRLERTLVVPEDGMTIQDINAINELAEIVTSGRTTRSSGSVSFVVGPEAVKDFYDACVAHHKMYVRETSEGSFVELFGTSISTGPMVRDIEGFVEIAAEEIDRIVNGGTGVTPVPMRLVGISVVESFSNWLPK